MTRRRTVRTLDLPAWPIVSWIVSLPVGWILGIGFALPLVWGVVASALLAARGYILFPRMASVWLGFLTLVVMSVVMLDAPERVIGAVFRLTNYISATVAFVYVYNASARRLSDVRVAGLLIAYACWVVVGGWLGILFPEGGLTTPMAVVMPQALLANDLVVEWVYPQFAEVQQPWGAPTPFARPSAPFPYTNGWGVNYALLLPFLVSGAVRWRGWRRSLIIGVLLASVVPAAATLNRGMFLAIGIGLTYSAARAAASGKIAPLFILTLSGMLAGIAFTASGGTERLLLRLSVSQTNETRDRIYREAFERTTESPFLGWGAPRPSSTMDLSVGTQGHIWNVMFSHGFLALVLFVGTVWWFAWKTRGGIGPERQAAHVTAVMASFAIVYYGFDGTQLLVLFLAAAIGCRPVPGDLTSDTDGEARAVRRGAGAGAR